MFSEVGHGEQSIVGFLKVINNEPKFVKIARDISFIIQHEFTIMKALQKYEYLRPFFCNATSLSTVYSKSVMRIKSESEIFVDSQPSAIPKFAMQLDYIPGAESLDDWVSSQRDVSIVWSVLQQVVAIIKMAHDKIKFTHYDLHTDNILMRKTDRKPGFVRIFKFASGALLPVVCGEEDPVIIDFGRAYCDELIDTPLNVELYNTHAGLFSAIPHPTFDLLFFLNGCSELIKKRFKDSKLKNKLKPYSRQIDENGWWKSSRISALDVAASLIKLNCKDSEVFGQNLPQALIIFSHLCIIPFQVNKDYLPSYFWPYYFKKFLAEWLKFEKWIKDEARLFYFLSYFISNLNVYRETYFDPIVRKNAEIAIQTKLQEFLNIECENKWSDRNINWTELIRCAYLAGQMLEGLLCENIKTQESEFSSIHANVSFEKLLDAIPLKFVMPNDISGGELIDAITSSITQLSSAQVQELLRV